MRRSIFALVLVGLVACAGAGHGDTVEADSGIRGKAVVGPTCPVETAEKPCPDRPFEARFQVVDDSGKVAATVHTGEDGRFDVSVAPGRYVLRSEESDSPVPFLKDVAVRVRAHEFTSVVVHFDSGIR